MRTKLMNINQSAWYWGALALFGGLVLAVALYFQYARNEWPCVLCIHARIWVLGFTLAALLGLIMRRNRLLNGLAHGLVLVMAIGLLERAWILLGTERGTLFGDCSMDSGLPPWFALDKWFPQVFEVQASCGYTPELWSGFTMAEALLVTAVLLGIVSALQLLVSLLRRVRQH
jgi:disulfide bond formation protein DsbB